MTERRDFIRKMGLSTLAFGTLIESESFAKDSDNNKSVNATLSIENHIKNFVYQPLQSITIRSSIKGIISVRDGKAGLYIKSNKEVDSFTFLVAGSLGNHIIFLEDKNGKLIDAIGFQVNCKTEIVDSKGKYKELLSNLEWTLKRENDWSETTIFRMNGRIYSVFVGWLRDHTHTMKGMKYFHPVLKDGFDLFANSQREDGMVFDNLYSRYPEPDWWDKTLEKGNFGKNIENGYFQFRRQPVEADVEYLFVECLYYTWKATGDNAWMMQALDKAIKALNYSTSDEYRFSKKYNLIKRGFTIDTWDFVHEYDSEMTANGSGQAIDPKINDFGIMHGDNTGFVASSRYLSEMLTVANRNEEAKLWIEKANDFEKRLNKLAWNGSFFTHFVPEPEDFWKKRDIGKTDPSSQVSLSNAYALNRGIGKDKQKAIIETYLKIRKNLPKGSPGEYYTIYPIFEKGFGKDNEAYEYMNGGVISIVAGELARGAFENGYEQYGVEILDNILALSRKYNNYLNCTLRGAAIDVPQRSFEPISIKNIANADFNGKGAKGVPGWSGEGEDNDLKNMPIGSQTFRDIPFEIVDPSKNGRKGALIISNDEGYIKKSTLKVSKKAKTIYILQATSKSNLIATITLKYKDGTSFVDYVLGNDIGNWWYPQEKDNWKVAFGVENNKSKRVGLGIYSLLNPNFEKEIESIDFEIVKDNNSKWFIGGVTLSKELPFFDKGDISFGIPDRWGAAAVVYGLVEGLVGVVDEGVAFDKVLLSPKWASTEENKVSATIKYEASLGFVKYNYIKTDEKINILATSSSTDYELKILLPRDKNVENVMLNNEKTQFNLEKIENSTYLTVNIVNKFLLDLTINF